MLFVKKIKFFVFMTYLVLVGQVFATECAEDYVAPDNTVWDGISTQEPCTRGKYYIVDNAPKLAWISDFTNKVNGQYVINKDPVDCPVNVLLEADLDMGDLLFVPICGGAGDKKFKGEFNGNGHTISNLRVNGAELAEKTGLLKYAQNVGFFGSMKNGGTIKNLILENVDIQSSTNIGLVNINSQISVGSVVGWQEGGTIDGCVVSGTIQTSGNGQGVGGVVGNFHSGTVTNCLSTVSIIVSGQNAQVGGIVGLAKNAGTKNITSCVYAGNTLKNNGTGGSVGAILGKQVNGQNLNVGNSYYTNGVADGGVGASAGTMTDKSLGVQNVNNEETICYLNGGTIDDGECSKEAPWSVGENSLSLNGSDGYTITFNAKSGTFPDGAKKKKVILKDRIITPEEISTPVCSAPACTDKAFAGWSLDPEATEPDDDLGSVSGAATVYAVWYPIFTITFSAAPGKYADGTTVTKTVKVAKGDKISVTGIEVPTIYKRNDSTLYFTGWSDSQKEFKAEDNIADSDTLHLDDITAESDTIFYAAWTKAVTYTVTYNANGHGKTKVDFVNVTKGQTLTEPPAPTPDNGYEYTGWCVNAACNTHFNFNTEIKENYTLYADWKAIDYTITYNLNGGTNSKNNPATYTIEREKIELQIPEKTGYDFLGWYYDKNFEERAKQITHGSTGAKTFYAKWEKSVYKISYTAGNDAYGTVTADKKDHGTSITLKNEGIFTREGYSQDGWSTSDGGEWAYALGATYSTNADITLYPHWVQGNVEVSPYGAVTIYTYAANDVRAVINGDYTGSEAAEITENITVNSVTLDRTFNVGVISTLYVPFNIAIDNIGGATVYKFKTIVKSDVDGRWKFKVSTAESVEANTPYIVMPSNSQVTFDIAESVTLNTTNKNYPSESQWTFKGTYEYISFAETSDEAFYVFAGQNIGGTKLGEFVKSSGYANPMRAYLVYDKKYSAKKSINGHLGGSIPLPNEIDIEVENEKGIVVETGKLNTVTGAVRMDCWFDLKGRRLNSRPTAKGTYYKNGKKTIIK